MQSESNFLERIDIFVSKHVCSINRIGVRLTQTSRLLHHAGVEPGWLRALSHSRPALEENAFTTARPLR